MLDKFRMAARRDPFGHPRAKAQVAGSIVVIPRMSSIAGLQNAECIAAFAAVSLLGMAMTHPINQSIIH